MSYHRYRQQCAKRRSESVKFPIFQKIGIETGDEVERKNRPSEEVTGTEEFSIENIEVPQDSVHIQKWKEHNLYGEIHIPFEPAQCPRNELIFFTENSPTFEQNAVIEEIAQDPCFYSPKISKGSVVAVAWGKIYTIGKVFVDIREGQRKIICVEELAKKRKDIYCEETAKKKIDAETEFICEVAGLEDLGDDRYRLSNIDKIKRHFQMFIKQSY